MLRLTLRDITLIVLGVIIAEIIGPLLRPILSPTLEPLLPSLGEQTQWLLRYYTDAQLNKAIRYASAGYGDSAVIISSQLAGFSSFGIFLFIAWFCKVKLKEA
jgi:hypothetical protein